MLHSDRLEDFHRLLVLFDQVNHQLWVNIAFEFDHFFNNLLIVCPLKLLILLDLLPGRHFIGCRLYSIDGMTSVPYCMLYLLMLLLEVGQVLVIHMFRDLHMRIASG